MNISEITKLFKSSSSVSEELANLKLAHTELSSNFEKVSSEYAKLKNDHSLISSELDDIKGEFKKLEIEANTAAVKAVQIVSSIGIEPVATIKTDESNSVESKGEQYSKITDPIARSAFFKANSKEILDSVKL